ncbi:LOW QUALITY PROTEIN: putative helicase mov-10-B.1 [Chaetodon auriga]|uniref:LOW QUALITY PROTEIN: putative helicase mov-10-B.1 n=1 Tax=Chaetodon auriga TaxID=39042 RepID=UPI00403295C1
MFSRRVAWFCRVGLDFYDFLKETDQDTVSQRIQLKHIYNVEFRTTDPETKFPSFGSVLYGLKVHKKIIRRDDCIYFRSKVRARYRGPRPPIRGCPPQRVQSGASNPGTVQTFRHEAVEGVQAGSGSLLMETDSADKHSICISCISPNHQFENEKLCLNVDEREQCVVNLKVENTGAKPVYFISYIPPKLPDCFTLTDKSNVTKTNPLCLKQGDSYDIPVNICCSSVGFDRAELAFEFKPDLQTNAFRIVRFIDVHCLSALGRELAPKAPYKPRSLPARTPKIDYEIVDGQPPERTSDVQLKSVIPLPHYPIPDYIVGLLEHTPKTYIHDIKHSMLEDALSWEDYKEKFQLLLYLEELQMQVDIKRYNIPNDETKEGIFVRDPINSKLLVLKVPGLSENRPSVLRGDALLACPLGQNEVKYRGYVHSVQLDTVKLGFNSKLLNCFVDDMKFSVEFTVTRLTLRLQHRAAELAVKRGLREVLFPAVPASTSQQTKLQKLVLFDSKLEKNPEQYQAVQHIVAGSSKPAPYLVFGPPGTGKTVTLVEGIKQVNKNQDSSCHILACAPSNSAADLLCQRIVGNVDKHLVLRMYALYCESKSVPEDLKACSNLKGQCFVFPTKEELMEYRIIVTTLFTAGRLVTGGIPEGHFTHIFVDEAGQATETQCLIPLAGLLNPESGQVVLAGDPKQLGPIVRSSSAVQYGLGVSLLERMMNHYAEHPQNKDMISRFVTKLLRNYRSHPDILEFPNQRFYEGKLKASADEIVRTSFCRWEHLPTQGFPVIFHGVAGINEREASSPSVFNRAEVQVLIDYVKKLLQTNSKRGLGTISPSDIGIIAPYRKQVQKIRQGLDKVGRDLRFKDLSGLKVGTVEEFQGQERRVIIVSTVRSHHSQTMPDEKFNLGFVKNDKRFNVAMTRAKALLIVVGNPSALTKDDTWKQFIMYCKDKGGYTGFAHAEEDEDLLMNLAACKIDSEDEVETAESAFQQLVELDLRNDQ